jgi:hypothetical protein
MERSLDERRIVTLESSLDERRMMESSLDDKTINMMMRDPSG